MFNRNARRSFVRLPAFAAFVVSILGKRTNRMPKISYLVSAFMLVVSLLFAGPALNVSASPLATATTPSLGAAASFGILATDYLNFATPTTIITGDVGYANGLGSYLLAMVSGTTYTTGLPYTNAVAAQAAALTALDLQPCDIGKTFAGGQNLSLLPQPLSPGVYCVTGNASIGSTLTLSGSGTYIFRITDQLTTGTNSVVSGASACDVFWTRVEDVQAQTQLGAGSTFLGTVINPSGIQVGRSVQWTGRALAAGGQVRTEADQIIVPDCTAAPSSALTITKSDGVTTVPAGSSTTYKVRVTNSGASSVTGAVLLDDMAAGLTKTSVTCSATPGQCVSPAPTAYQLEHLPGFALPQLAPGQFYEIVVTAHVDATNGSVTNHAIVVPPQDPSGAVQVNDTDTVAGAQNPALTLVKSIHSGSPYHAVGDTIVYLYTVTNTGTVRLPDPVTVTDDHATDELCASTLSAANGNSDLFLDPGESVTCTASHTITQADLNAGFLTNHATAHAGQTNSNQDQATACAAYSSYYPSQDGAGFSSYNHYPSPDGGHDGCPGRLPPPPLPHTGFLPEPSTVFNNQPVAQYETDNNMSMDIPWLGISRMSIVGVPLADGTWNVDALGANAGWLETTALPGQSGNSVISGHVTDIYGWDGPFSQLDKLAAGDDITIHAYGQIYTYRVQWVRNVAPDDSSVLTDAGDTTLTLVTCSDPNYTTHTYDERLIVRAVLVQQNPE